MKAFPDHGRLSYPAEYWAEALPLAERWVQRADATLVKRATYDRGGYEKNVKTVQLGIVSEMALKRFCGLKGIRVKSRLAEGIKGGVQKGPDLWMPWPQCPDTKMYDVKGSWPDSTVYRVNARAHADPEKRCDFYVFVKHRIIGREECEATFITLAHQLIDAWPVKEGLADPPRYRPVADFEYLFDATPGPVYRPGMSRIIGQDKFGFSPEARQCWHCKGLKKCNCASCLEFSDKIEDGHWRKEPATCGACLGAGSLCWADEVIYEEQDPDRALPARL